NLEINYYQRFTNHYEWLSSAQKHLHSAKLFDTYIKKLIAENKIFEDKFAFDFASYRGSLLLLIGLALENAIKGLIIFKEKKCFEKLQLDLDAGKIKEFRNIETIRKKILEFEKNYKWDRSHNLKEMYRKNLDEAYSEYADFFDRVTENLIWMGKYELPQPNQYYSNMEKSRDYYENDILIAESIIEGIVEQTTL
ncbi:MAG: hypothetical protein KUL78_09080, partial [Flavobacterium sp.]|nr:hypothetical protein [Flavobacterium sp.]